MGHVRDRWTDPGPDNKRVRNERWGKGKRWQARWVEDGRERSLACATKNEAETRIALADAGIAPTTGTGITLSAYFDLWTADQIHHRKSTTDNSLSRWTVRIKPKLGSRTLEAITARDVQDAVNEWAKTYSPQTVHGTYGLLAQIFNHAVQHSAVTASPCHGIKLPKIGKKRVVPMTRDQVEAIRDAFPEHLASMVTVGAAQGLRLGELRGLTIDRLTRRTLTVDRQLSLDGTRFVDVKTDAGNRDIRLTDTARRAIDAHVKKWGTGPDGLIWHTLDGQPITHWTAGHAWFRAKQKVPGLRPRSGFHDLRHYNASLLIASGLSVRAVADWLGHEDAAITLRVYAHLWPTDQNAAVKAIDAALG